MPTSDTPKFNTPTSTTLTFRTCTFAIRLARIAVLILTSFLLFSGTWTNPALAQQTFQVNNRGNASDANPGDGTCDTGGGVCTLRAAIEEANADPDDDTIRFGSIPTTGGFAVLSTDSSIRITQAVTVDATTAPGWSNSGPPIVVLDGSGATSTFTDGIQVDGAAASGTSISGLAIVNFPDDGISIVRDADNARISYCYIGIDVDGTTPAGNGWNGVNIRTDDVVVGRDGILGGRNVISGNTQDGVYISGSNTIIGGNYIGTTASGDAAVGNERNGVNIASGTGHIIGNIVPFFDRTINIGNVISGNRLAGVRLDGEQSTVEANLIGTNASGTVAIPNSRGIEVNGVDNMIGPSADGPDRNIISGNDRDGIRTGIAGTSQSGDFNTIQFNYVGVDRSGVNPLGNGGGPLSGKTGIRVDQGSGNLIRGNVVSSNVGNGIFIGPSTNTVGNEISSNYIGTNRNSTDLGNGASGVVIEGGSVTGDPNVVGGLNEGDGNVIGFNDGSGVIFSGLRGTAVRNFIGTNPSGDNLSNGATGIVVSGTSDVQIGLDGSLGFGGLGNTIGFNLEGGITIENSTDVLVSGNYIGTNEIGSGLANGLNGVSISGGGPNAGIIVGSSYSVPVDSDPSPDSGGSGNRIAFNAQDGISVSESVTGVSIRGNLVYNNGFLGIDLGENGLTANDAGDGDSGPNNLQNTPEIDQAQTQLNPSTGEVEVRYRVRCNTTDCNYGTSGLRVDFYLADQEESGQGETYVHTDTYPSSAATSYRLISFSPPSGVTVTQDDFIVATATDADNNTSEFSPPPAPQLPVELAGLAAQPTGNTVVLTWKTLSEQGNDRFEIERKGPDATAFRTVGTVDGAGTTTETTDYRFVTNDLLAGTHTFRLRQVDVDGTDDLSRTVTARVQLAEPIALSAPAPNPVRNQLSVRMGVQEAQTVRVVLYDLLGRAVATLHEGTLPGGEERTLRATLRALPSGKYFLRLEGETGQAVRPVTIIR